MWNFTHTKYVGVISSPKMSRGEARSQLVLKHDAVIVFLWKACFVQRLVNFKMVPNACL